MTLVKNAIRRLLSGMVRVGSRGRVGRYVYEEIVTTAMGRVSDVTHGGAAFRFAVPNSLTRWRAETFASKEPETLQWIDGLRPGAILWDVGANIGQYSIYAAKVRGCSVWAFEPSVFNLELLARNVYLNAASDQICLVPLALTDSSGAQHMRMTTTAWGGALSTFGRRFGWDGTALREVFAFRTLGVTMDDAVDRLGVPRPDYIKIDVDGLEHFILAGGSTTLQSVESVLIEVNDNFHDQADQCHMLLSRAGLTLRDKRQSATLAASTTGFDKSFNQIWAR